MYLLNTALFIRLIVGESIGGNDGRGVLDNFISLD